jgi:hypothetical protein
VADLFGRSDLWTVNGAPPWLITAWGVSGALGMVRPLHTGSLGSRLTSQPVDLLPTRTPAHG